jgi:hypothetical protein
VVKAVLVPVRVRLVALAVAAAAAVLACAQVLGIQSIHDDPAGGGDGGLGDQSVPDHSVPDQTVADQSVPDVGADASFDAGPDTNGPNPALACPPVDGGATLFIRTGVEVARFALHGKYVFIALGVSRPGLLRCPVEGCAEAGAAVYTAASGIALDVAANANHIFWLDNANQLQAVHIADLDGTDIATKLVTAADRVVNVGSNAYVLSGGGVSHVSDSPAGIDASVDWVRHDVSVSYGELAASASWVAFTDYDDAGATNVFVCPTSGCPDGAAPVDQIAPYDINYPAVHVAVDESNVYYTNPAIQAVVWCPVSGCSGPRNVVASGVVASSVAVDSTGIYYGVEPFGVPASLQKAPFDGGSPVFVADPQHIPIEVGANSACVYWTTAAGLGGNVDGVLYAAPNPSL